MYRIRSASGTELVYNSLEEFHAAVRRGEVLAEDEIFHTRANRWLDVKSHPHYRSAMGWNGAPAAPAAPPAAPAPRPVAAAPMAPQPPRVEAPRPAAPQTVIRPQLVAEQPPVQAAAPAQRVASPPPPPRKSRELAFIDIGEPQPGRTQNATIIEAQKAPATQAPAARAEPAKPGQPVKPAGSELQFLVMDNGIESPVRNSAGHRTVPEDLNLLFDAPMPAAPAGSATAVAPPPAPPKTEAVARPVAEPPRPEPVPAEPPKQTVARVEVVRPPAPKVEAPAAAVVATPRPSAPKLEVVKAATPSAEPARAAVVEPPPVAPASPEAPKASSPKLAVVAKAPPAAPELDIPGESILTAPVTPVPVPSHAATRRLPVGLMLGAGAFVLVLGVAVAAWKPWAGTGTAAAATTSAVPDSAPGSPMLPLSATPTGAAGKPATTPRGGSATRPRDSAATTDSVVRPESETVLAVARPNFRPNLDVGNAGIPLGSEIGAGDAGAVVPPSDLARRLVQAERQAQQDLAARLVNFRTVLAPDRIATADGAGRARAAWLAGADAIRTYRARIARLEQAYEDSVLTSQRARRWPPEETRAWTARQSLAEPAEVAQLADLMTSQVSEGLELLASLEGQYQLKGERIAFTSSGPVPRYLSIRSWVEQRMGTWQATPENARAHSLTMMLRALGEGFPAAQ